MKANERQQLILEELQNRGTVTVEQLATLTKVSTVTIRADLAELDDAQLLRRVRGGAVATVASRYEGAASLLRSLNKREKERIVHAAYALIDNGFTIFINSGTTAELLALHMPDSVRDLVVATNSINVAHVLGGHPGVEVIVTGGTLRPGVNSLVAPLGDVILREINADLSLISSTGVCVRRGFTNSSWAEAEVAKAMVRGSRKTVFLADHAKLGHVALARIVSFDRANILITDKKAPNDFLREAKQTGVDIVTA